METTDTFIETLLVESHKRHKDFRTTAETILLYCNYQSVTAYFKIDTAKAKNKKEIIAEMLKHLNNDGFEHYNNLITTL